MRVLITGGAGFIGSHLAQALLARGAAVRILDNLSSGRRANLDGLDVDLIVGDVADRDAVRAAVDGCDVIWHQAALVSVPLSIKDPQRTHASNVTGTFNVFDAARTAGIRRVVFASSAAVYGNRPGLPKRESDPVELLTPYAASKYMDESYAAAFNASYGMEIVALRYMNVFGPRQDPSSPYSGVLSIFCRAAVNGAPVTIFGDGEQTRDFVAVDDVVQANWLAATGPFDPQQAVFNVGRGEQTSLNQIVTTLGGITGQPLTVNYAPERPGDIRYSVADIGRIQAHLGYRPAVDISTGLQRTLAWFAQAAATS